MSVAHTRISLIKGFLGIYPCKNSAWYFLRRRRPATLRRGVWRANTSAAHVARNTNDSCVAALSATNARALIHTLVLRPGSYEQYAL